MKPLKILYLCSELAPLVSTGGLADVAGALPRALRAQGHDVRVALPCYDVIPKEHRGSPFCLCVAELGVKTAWGTLRCSYVPRTDLPLYLVEHDGYFARGRLYGSGAYEFDDNPERYCFFSQAVLHGVAQTGWIPDIVHCNDWHTAVVPALIRTRFSHSPVWRGMPSLFTIHNLGYQGRYKARFVDYSGLGWSLFTPECLEFYGDMNLMKAGIAYATKVNTVSPRYAQEIQTPVYGEGLDGFLSTRKDDLVGILNGVDYSLWSPKTDRLISDCYSVDDLAGKQRCKEELQRFVGLPQRDVPLIGMVSRIHWQKGIDLLAEAADKILSMNLQLIVLGTGDPDYEGKLEKIAARHRGRMRLLLRFDPRLSHEIEAGSDFFLMPSHYEPCGLSQLYSLAYGAIPIVRETGGLADSVNDVNDENIAQKRATGIVFAPCTSEALTHAVGRAVDLYRNPKLMMSVRKTGMKQDFSWERSSHEYVRLYQAAIARP